METGGEGELLSDFGDKILASLKEFGEAIEAGKPLASSAWYATEIACQGCVDGKMLRVDRTTPEKPFDRTFVCRDCNAAFWVEGSDEASSSNQTAS